MRKALIIGSEGQDGKLLRLMLERKGYSVSGVGRSKSTAADYLQFDLASHNYDRLLEFIGGLKPEEIYYVAAFHHSSQDESSTGTDSIDVSVSVNQLGLMKVMDLCRNKLPECRIVYTSSSLIFAGSGSPMQDENTKPAPRCIYSVTKCAAMEAADYFRAVHGLFVSVAIMYNHESIYRSERFLSKKIVTESRMLAENKINSITIGDLSSETDWGYAPDYVEGLHHIINLPAPGTFVVSSGRSHKVRDWFRVLEDHLSVDLLSKVEEKNSLITRKKPVLIGNPEKILSTGWKPRTTFSEMVVKMYNNVI